MLKYGYNRPQAGRKGKGYNKRKKNWKWLCVLRIRGVASPPMEACSATATQNDDCLTPNPRLMKHFDSPFVPLRLILFLFLVRERERFVLVTCFVYHQVSVSGETTRLSIYVPYRVLCFLSWYVLCI